MSDNPLKDHDKKTRHAFIEILESIAAEQDAISCILYAEGEKIKKVAESELPTTDDFDEIISFQNSVANVIEKLITKQTILLEELKIIKDICLRPDDECDSFNVNDEE